MLHSKKLFQKANVVSIYILATFCMLAASCSDEETISIPKNLAGSQWSMWFESQTTSLKFTTESQCEYSETPANNNAETYFYTYKYDKPNLTLIPLDSQREILTGYIVKKDSRSIALYLFTPEGNEFFVAWHTTYFE